MNSSPTATHVAVPATGWSRPPGVSEFLGDSEMLGLGPPGLLDILGPPLDNLGAAFDISGPPLDMLVPPLDILGPPLDMLGPPLDILGPPLDISGPLGVFDPLGLRVLAPFRVLGPFRLLGGPFGLLGPLGPFVVAEGSSLVESSIRLRSPGPGDIVAFPAVAAPFGHGHGEDDKSSEVRLVSILADTFADGCWMVDTVCYLGVVLHLGAVEVSRYRMGGGVDCF